MKGTHITTSGREEELFRRSTEKPTTYSPPERGLFIIPTSQADYLLSGRFDRSQIEMALGLEENSLQSGNLIRIDVPNPFDHNPRMPDPATGNQYHGPNTGLTPAGFNESVIDAIPRNNLNIEVNNLGDILRNKN